MDVSIRQRIEQLLDSHPIVLFMKGNKQFPQCGFSAKVVDALRQSGAEFHVVNVLTDPDIRQGIKDFSDWPTIPQLYVRGKFVGGCDIVSELQAKGELSTVLADKS